MTNGRKYDKGKLRFSLFPQQALWGIIEVLEHGAAKYDVNNWMHVEDSCTRYFDAMHRHLAAMERGETLDPDSGLPHAWHMCCSAIIAGAQYMGSPESRRQWVERAARTAPFAPPAPARDPELDRQLDLEIAAEIGGPANEPCTIRYVGPPEGAPPPQEPHTHIWELVHTDVLKAWHCHCGANVRETANGRYRRYDSNSEFVSEHSTYFQATHVP